MSEAAVQGAAAHDEGAHPHVNYMAKFYWLVALTTAEVAVAFGVSGGWKLALLTFLSFWKAGIVLRYFMHLKTEGIGLKLLVAFPGALIVILVMLFLADGYFLNYSAM
jgi:cytochrome c oxidase subunit IV